MTATHQPCTRHWQQKQFTVGDGDAHQPASFLGVGFNVTENQTRTPLVHATQPRSKAELTERKRSRIGKGAMGGRRGGRARRCPRRLASRLDGRDSGHAGHAAGHCRDRFVHEQIAHLETQAAFSFFSFFPPKWCLGQRQDTTETGMEGGEAAPGTPEHAQSQDRALHSYMASYPLSSPGQERASWAPAGGTGRCQLPRPRAAVQGGSLGTA